MNPVRDAFIIVGIIIALIVVSAVIRSNPSASRSFSGISLLPAPYVPLPRPATITPSSEPTIPAPKEKTVKEIEREIAQIESEIAKIKIEIERIEKYGEDSPYKGMVTMRKNIGSFRTRDVNNEQVRLDINRSNTSNVIVSDWKIESAVTGRNVKIPEAVGLVFAGNSGSKEPIVARPGDSLYITTGRSPIGHSFRVNKCSGYYEQFQNFNPQIRRQCPDPDDEILNYTRDTSIFTNNACMDFVERINICNVQTKPLPITLSPACQEAIIEEINYGSCVDNHKNDENFYVPEWRVYLKRDLELWREKRELIKLLDENGKTVDYYSY